MVSLLLDDGGLPVWRAVRSACNRSRLGVGRGQLGGKLEWLAFEVSNPAALSASAIGCSSVPYLCGGEPHQNRRCDEHATASEGAGPSLTMFESGLPLRRSGGRDFEYGLAPRT